MMSQEANNNKRNKRVNVDSLVGDMGAKQGERITDNLNNSLLNTEQVIKVSLSKVYLSKQIRLKIHQDKVDQIVATYPLRAYPEIRKVDPLIDGDSVPDGFDYVLLTGEHRFQALMKLKFQEHDFKFVPPSLIKTKADVIMYQFVENNVRADMHIIEKAHSLVSYMEAAQCTKGEAAAKLSLANALISRLLRIVKYFTEKDIQLAFEYNINSERVLVGITKLIELGHTDWLSLVKPYALNEEGLFDPSLLYESSINKLIKDLTAPPEPEKSPEPVFETPKRLADDIMPNAFKEDSGQQSTSDTAQKPLVSTEAKTPATPTETTQDNPPVQPTTAITQQESGVLEAKGSTSGLEHSPTTSPATSSPVTTVVKNEASFKLVANVLQQVLEGKDVEEILMGIGSDIKAFVSKEDGADIYEMIQNLPFNN
jgi:hypothetical protein